MTAVWVAAAQSGPPGVTACSGALQSLAPGHCSKHILQGPVLGLVHLVAPQGAVDVHPLTEAQGDESPGDGDTVIIVISMVAVPGHSTQNTLASVVTRLVITLLVVKKYFLHIELGSR